MSVPPGTEMFQFPGFASRPYVFRPGYPRKGGFPHSDICGSTIARISPQLIAACHVLHRLLAPRHPPNALVSLEIHHHRPHAGPNRALQAKRDAAPEPQPQNTSVKLPTNSIFTCERTPAPRSPPQGHHARRRSWKNGNHPATPPRRRANSKGRRPGGSRSRTDDPLLAKQVLYQLSYAPTAERPTPRPPSRTKPHQAQRAASHPSRNRPPRQPRERQWAREDLNLRPHAYQACALTN